MGVDRRRICSEYLRPRNGAFDCLYRHEVASDSVDSLSCDLEDRILERRDVVLSQGHEGRLGSACEPANAAARTLP